MELTREQHKKLVFEYISKPEQEINEIFNTGMFNEICKGYLVLAMKSTGADRQVIREAVQELENEFDAHTAGEARNAYKNL